jgi:hypothetical protein
MLNESKKQLKTARDKLKNVETMLASAQKEKSAAQSTLVKSQNAINELVEQAIQANNEKVIALQRENASLKAQLETSLAEKRVSAPQGKPKGHDSAALKILKKEYAELEEEAIELGLELNRKLKKEVEAHEKTKKLLKIAMAKLGLTFPLQEGPPPSNKLTQSSSVFTSASTIAS